MTHQRIISKKLVFFIVRRQRGTSEASLTGAIRNNFMTHGLDESSTHYFKNSSKLRSLIFCPLFCPFFLYYQTCACSFSCPTVLPIIHNNGNMMLQRFIEYENSKMYFILYTSLQLKVGHDVITVINCSD